MAFADLEAIGDFIAKDNPGNAANFVNGLIDRSLSIALAPEGYVARPELGEAIRSVAYDGYLIFYAAQDDLIRIERILHGSRDYLSKGFL